MSFSSATIETRPTVVAAATVKNLVADVARVADQNQMVMQDSNAFSGARSTNDMTDTAVITQDASAANNKDIKITPPVSADTVSVLAENFDSIGRAIIDQNQGSAQGAFAQGTDFDGNPSESVNNLDLNEEVNRRQVTKIGNPELGIRTAGVNISLDAEIENPESEGSTNPQSAIHIPQSDHPLSVAEERNRLAPSSGSYHGFSFVLAERPLPLNVFQHEFVHPNPLQLPSTPVIESNYIVTNLTTLGPDLVFSHPIMAIHPNVFTLPAPPRLNVTA